MTTIDAGPRRRRARHRAPVRPRTVLRRLWVVTGLLVAAVSVGLLATGGTYALYSASAPAPAGVVRSGSASLTLTAASGLSLAGLTPGSSVVVATTAANPGDVPLALTVATADLVARWDEVPGSSLDELRLRVTPVSTTSACRAGLSGRVAYLRSWATPAATGVTLPRGGGQGVLCLELALDADAPKGVQGAVDSFSVVVTGRQVAA